MRRRMVLAAFGVVAAGGAVAAAAGFERSSEGTPRRATQPPKTADITRATLTDFEEVTGELGHGAPIPLRYHASGAGVVTWLPPVGATVDRGGTLFRVNNEPVALLFGTLPLYRPLGPGAEGPDVKQLEDNLRALRYAGFTSDEGFTAATATAVKKWQKTLGMAQTGAIAPGRVFYTAGPIRVAEHKVRVGDPAGGEILAFTGTVRHVTVALPVTQQRFAVAGGTVQVTLPDGRPVQGKVESVGSVASATGSGGEGEPPGPPTVEVGVSIADQAALGPLQQGPVKVRFVAEERADVLTVPIAALVALAEGGYGVQVVEGATTRYVAVETGMFANGRVEIRGGELRPGMKVGVPK